MGIDKLNFFKSSTPNTTTKPESKPSQTVENMFNYYSEFLKSKYQVPHDDKITISLFQKLDKNRDRDIDITEQMDLYNAIEQLNKQGTYQKEINNMFGDSYTEATQTNKKNRNQAQAERVIQTNINKVLNKIQEYANQHPEEEQIQKYANKIDKFKSKINVVRSDNPVIGYFDFKTQSININANITNNLNEAYLAKLLIHETTHIDGDALSSQAEELNAEQTGIEIAEKIYNTTLVENKEEYLNKFIKPYQQGNLPEGVSGNAEYSPGYGGVPTGAGIEVEGEIQSVQQNENNYVIKTRNKDDNTHEEYRINMKDKKDKNGVGYAESASVIVEYSDGDTEAYEYSDYDKKHRYFTKIKDAEVPADYVSQNTLEALPNNTEENTNQTAEIRNETESSQIVASQQVQRFSQNTPTEQTSNTESVIPTETTTESAQTVSTQQSSPHSTKPTVETNSTPSAESNTTEIAEKKEKKTKA